MIVWVVRWDSPFGVTYLAKRQSPPKRPVRRKPGHVRRFFTGQGTVGPKSLYAVVDHPKEAFPFTTKEAAEGAALLIVAKDPAAMMGKTSVREWDGKKRYP